jgi:putative transposase
MRARHPEHLRGFSYVGFHRYSLRFCTNGRRPVFITEAPVTLVLAQILRASTERSFAVIAYCFMPNHLHLLVEGTDAASDLKRFVVSLKQYSGFLYAQRFGTRLWQRYGFERVLRDREPTFVVARYILENPVRAGLAKQVAAYPFVGSLVYTLPQLVDSVYAEASRSG